MRFGELEMSGNKMNKFYWDACIFFAHLKQEKNKHPDSIPAISKLFEFMYFQSRDLRQILHQSSTSSFPDNTVELMTN